MNAEDRMRVHDIQDAHRAADAIESCIGRLAGDLDAEDICIEPEEMQITDALDKIRRVLPPWQV